MAKMPLSLTFLALPGVRINLWPDTLIALVWVKGEEEQLKKGRGGLQAVTVHQTDQYAEIC